MYCETSCSGILLIPIPRCAGVLSGESLAFMSRLRRTLSQWKSLSADWAFNNTHPQARFSTGCERHLVTKEWPLSGLNVWLTAFQVDVYLSSRD